MFVNYLVFCISNCINKFLIIEKMILYLISVSMWMYVNLLNKQLI